MRKKYCKYLPHQSKIGLRILVFVFFVFSFLGWDSLLFGQSITQQPQGATICTGGTHTLVVETNPDTQVSYQWQKTDDFIEWEYIPGADENEYSTPVLNSIGENYYRVRAVFEESDTIFSNEALVEVVSDITIDTQPADVTICPDTQTTLSVAASGGTPSLDYQWEVFSEVDNWSTAPGISTNPDYLTPSLSQSQTYRVIVSASGNGCSVRTSNEATVSIPEIVTQPVGTTQDICEFSTHQMSVSVDGAGTSLAYQWQINTDGVNWSNVTGGSGATTDTYTTEALTEGNYDYRCLITTDIAGCDPLESAIANVGVKKCADLAINISASESSPKVGDNVTFTIQLDNNGLSDATGIEVTHQQGVGFDYVSSTPGQGTYDESTGIWTVGALDATEGVILFLTLLVKAPSGAADEYKNTVSITQSDQDDPAAGNNSDSSELTPVFTPDWELTKISTTNPNTYHEPGDVLTYSITLENTGDVSVSSVVVSDPQATTGPTYVSGDTNENDILEVGETWTYTASYEVVQADIDAGSFENTATANGVPDTGSLDPASDGATVDATQSPNLEVTNVASPQTYDAAGDVITYTITISNTGNLTISAIQLDLPGVSFDTGDTDVGTIAPGDQQVVVGTRTMTQADLDNGSFSATATATGEKPDTEPISASDSEQVLANKLPELTLVAAGDPETYNATGNVISFTATVSNTGNQTINSIELIPPSEVTFSAEDLDIGTLAPGQDEIITGTYTITLEDMNEGSFSADFTVNGLDQGEEFVQDQATASVTGVQSPDIDVAITANPTTYNEVENVINYTITVANTGNVSIENIGLTVSGVELETGGGDLGTLIPGEDQEISGTRTITQADLDTGSFTAEASVSGTAPDGSIVSDQASTKVDAKQNARLALKFSANPTQYSSPGEIITFTATVTNTGNVTMSSIELSAGGVTFEPGDTNIGALAPGNNKVVTGTRTITQADIDNGSFSTIAEVTGFGPAGQSVSVSSSLTITALTDAQLTITNVASPINYDEVGEVITFTITVDNTGTVTITDVLLSVPGLTITSGSLSIGTLAPGDDALVTGTYTVDQSDIDNGNFSITATVNGKDPDNNTIEVSDTEFANAIQSPKLDVVAVASPQTYNSAGDVIDYTITVNNTGNVTINTIGLTASGVTLQTGGSDIGTLAPGGERVVTGTRTITQQNVDQGSFSVTATASGTAPGDVVVSDSDTEVVNTIQEPGISVNINATPETYDTAGEVISFSISVENTGNVTLDPVQLSVPGVTLESGGSNLGSMAPGTVRNITGTRTITQANIDNGSFNAIATVNGRAPDGTNISDVDNFDVTAIQNPGLTLNMVATPSTYDSFGQVITFTIVVQNSGNVTLSSLQLSVPGVSLGSSGSNIGTLAPGAEKEVIGTRSITQEDLDAGSFTTTAQVVGQEPDGTGISASDSETITANQNPELSVQVLASPQTYSSVGSVISYTITVSNTGNVTLTSVELSISNVVLQPGATNIGTLAPGANSEVSGTYTITQNDLDNGSFSSTATVSGVAPDSSVPEASTTNTIIAQTNPSITIQKSANVSTFNEPGDVINYTITITNNGNVNLTGIELQDPLTGLQESIATLAPGASQVFSNQTYTATQNDVNNGSIVNIASATALDPNSNIISASRELTIPVALQEPAIGINKTSGSSSFSAAGASITYTIEVLNLGNVSLSNITIEDPLTGMEEQINNLNPAELVVFNTNYIITQSDLDEGNVVNVAIVEAQDPDGEIITAQSELTLPAIQQPQLAVGKSLNAINNDISLLQYADIGDELEYKITIENTGNVTLNDIEVVDPLTGMLEVIVLLAPGGEEQFFESYIITLSDLNNGSVSNTASASGKAPNEEIVSDEDEAQVLAGQEPQIAATITLGSVNGDGSLSQYSNAGDELSFTVVVENTGNVTLNNIEVTDLLSEEIKLLNSLTPGQSENLTFIYGVLQNDMDTGSLDNLVEAIGFGPGEQKVEADDLVTVTAMQIPELTLVKELAAVNDNPSTTQYSAAGDELSFLLTLENTGNVTLTEINLMDSLSGFQQPISILAPGESETHTVSYTVLQQDINTGSLTNSASSDGLDPNNESVFAQDFVVVSASQISRLNISKTLVSVNGSEATTQYSEPGDVLEYSIILENTGNLPVTAIELLDPKTGLSDFISEFMPGESNAYSTSYTVNQNDLNNGNVFNLVVANGVGFHGQEILEVASSTVLANKMADLFVSLTTDILFFEEQGDMVEYTIEVNNTGNVTISNIILDDVLTGFSESITQLAPGGSQLFTSEYEITIQDMENGIVTNTLMVSGNDPQGVELNFDDSSSLTLLSDEIPEITLVKTSDPQAMVTAGEALSYFITVTNQSEFKDALNLIITDQLVDGLSFAGADNNGMEENNAVVWVLDTLAAMESIELRLDVIVNSNVPEGSVLENVAVANVQDLAFPQSNSVDLVINTLAELSITKEVDNDMPNVGDEVLYTLMVENEGPSDATNVRVHDMLPSGLRYIMDNGVGSYNPNTGIWVIGNLAVNETESLEISAMVNPTGNYTNSAILGADQFYPEVGQDSVAVTISPDLLVRIPQGFSPNNDGINDSFTIAGIESYPNNKLIIMNRWGNKVFEANRYNNDWDGTNQHGVSFGNQELPDGTYFYILDLGQPGPDGEQIIKGYIYLAR